MAVGGVPFSTGFHREGAMGAKRISSGYFTGPRKSYRLNNKLRDINEARQEHGESANRELERIARFVIPDFPLSTPRPSRLRGKNCPWFR